MDKLIELLNEWYLARYNKNPNIIRFEDYWGNDYWYFCSPDDNFLMVETEVWTKKYWFIKWLVDNDKIDMSKAKYYSDLIYYEDYWEWGWACKDYEFVIMLLSIQDNPIEFLVSILKIS